MKKFTQRVQRLGERANELRQFVESMPPKIVQVRDTVTATTSEVQKLRADILSSVATLRSETDTQLVTALREIDGCSGVLEDAGYRLEGVDMDLGPTRKIIVSLQRSEDADVAALRAAQKGYRQTPTVQALLAALIKAEELGSRIELTHLRYATLTVEVGLIPLVRIGWRAQPPAIDEPPPLPASALPASAPVPDLTPSLAESSFFARREEPKRELPTAAPASPSSSSTTPTAPAIAAPEPSSPVAPKPTSVLSADWKRSALDRFKKMPDLGVRGH